MVVPKRMVKDYHKTLVSLTVAGQTISVIDACTYNGVPVLEGPPDLEYLEIYTTVED